MSQQAGPEQADNITTTRAMFDAFANHDREWLERLVQDDFHFTSPRDNRLDRATYFERCWPGSVLIAGFEIVNILADNDLVFVTYEGRTVDGKRFRNTEVHTHRNGRIREVEVYFGWAIPHKAEPGGFVDEGVD